MAGLTSKRVLSRFLKLPQSSDAVMLEYIWIDGTGEGVRSKCKTMNREPQKPQGVCGGGGRGGGGRLCVGVWVYVLVSLCGVCNPTQRHQHVCVSLCGWCVCVGVSVWVCICVCVCVCVCVGVREREGGRRERDAGLHWIDGKGNMVS